MGATEGRAAFQVETTLAGRTSGTKGRMCVSGAAGAPALASAKGKGAPIWQGTGSSSRVQREHGSWPGSALLPGPRPIASQGMDSRGNGQRREITVWSLLAVIPSGENTGSGPDMQEEAQASGQTDRGRPRLY